MVVLVEATTHGFTLSFDWWLWRLLVAIGLCAVTIISVGVGAFAIALVFCYDIAMGMQSIRRSGALDDLLCTPVNHTRVARTFLWVHANRALPYIPSFVAAYVMLFLYGDIDPNWFQAVALPLLMLPSQLLLVICAGSYAGTRTNRAASQSALTILLLVLIAMFSLGITEIIRWFFIDWLPLTRGSRNSSLLTMGILLTVLFNLVSAGLCYVGFAGPLREDLITGMARPTPRFRRLSHMS
jgi:hypothetical protein